jgi:hypothetical protein
MSNMGKSLALVLILIMAVSSLNLLMIKPASAQSISKPSVPQFSLTVSGASTVQITITNQPLILTLNNESLYYNVRVKQHTEQNWTELYTNNNPDIIALKGTIPIQSNSNITVLTYSNSDNQKLVQLDFQVEAMYGYYFTQEPASHDPFVPSQSAFGILADGESGWSPIQSITIPANTSLSPTPTVPEFPLWTTPFLLIIMMAAGLSVCFKKHTHGEGEWA